MPLPQAALASATPPTSPEGRGASHAPDNELGEEMMKSDLYTTVTNQLIDLMESALETEKWEMPWHHQAVVPTNALTCKTYRGINTVSLWMAQVTKGYASPYWATFKQWKELGAPVKKGEKSSLIIFYNVTEYENEEGEEETRAYIRASYVFNAGQVEGWEPPKIAELACIERCDKAERLIGATGADIRHGMAGAYYHRSEDYIGMPDKASFRDTTTSTASENYYSTLLHELTHWTGHKSRLDRVKGKKFADEAYAFEELIAEIGAAMLCAQTGVAAEPRKDHALYLGDWLRALKNDKRYFFKAASAAQKAADFVCHYDG